MNDMYNPELIELGVTLTQLAIKSTATAVTKKIKNIKDEKNIDKVRNTYDEIITELLSERDEAIRIAQSYKSELDKVAISDDDINHLHNTVSRILELLKQYGVLTYNSNESSELVEDSNGESAVDEFEQIKELISVDTLKAMQLIGFNYKAAIGEPLTIVLKNIILSKAPKLKEENPVTSFLTPEMVEVLKNGNAYKNFKEIANIGIPADAI